MDSSKTVAFSCNDKAYLPARLECKARGDPHSNEGPPVRTVAPRSSAAAKRTRRGFAPSVPDMAPPDRFTDEDLTLPHRKRSCYPLPKRPQPHLAIRLLE